MLLGSKEERQIQERKRVGGSKKYCAMQVFAVKYFIRKHDEILLCTISKLMGVFWRGLRGRKHVTELSQFKYYFASVPISRINAFAVMIATPCPTE